MNGSPYTEKVSETASQHDEKERLVEGPPAARQEDGRTEETTAAAAMIQRNYRGYRERRQLRGMGLSPSTRWQEAVRELQYRNGIQTSSHARSSSMSTNRARQNWKRVGAIAARAGHDDSSDDEADVDAMTAAEKEKYHREKHEAKIAREKTAKMMDLQYFLEMVDTHHRYGSNLRTYHEEWKKADTHENFFYWLDHGAGRHLDLPVVSRERLDTERVRYLSREERQNYLIKIDEEGRLCWARNGERITTSLQYKDSVDGIVPRDDTTEPWRQGRDSSSSDGSSILSRGSTNENVDAYANHDLDRARGLKKLTKISASTILNQLLQRSVRPNAWIFVADTSFRLYLGIKQSGAFQHSSFLNGGRISAAGMMKIKNGQIRQISPLSGHYRPPTKNFRNFVHSMRDQGVDMSRVSISHSYAVLVGLEAYVKTRRKIKNVAGQMTHEKDKVLHPEEVQKREEEERDHSESAEKERQVIREERRRQEEAKKRESLGSKLMRKLRIRSPSQSASAAGKDEPTKQTPKTPLSVPGEDVESGIAPEAGEHRTN
ncbi:iq calmodulin-binding motif protein [Venturia nashicola]|nr:iq calmodulin-binding motif protein [Venturia nashicola]